MCDVPLRYYPNVYCSNIALRTSHTNHYATTTSDRPSKKDHRRANTNNFLLTTMLDFLPAICCMTSHTKPKLIGILNHENNHQKLLEGIVT